MTCRGIARLSAFLRPSELVRTSALLRILALLKPSALLRPLALQRLLAFLWLFVAAASLPAAAQQISYVIEDNGERVPVPLSYVFERDISDVGLSGASDLFLASDGILYVADTLNNRILKLSRDGRVLGEIGKSAGMKKPEGVFVSEAGDVYVADTGNRRVLIFGPGGSLVKDLGQPQSDLINADFPYQPTKLVVDSAGIIYVVSANDYRGMLRIDHNGAFKGVFADNRVGFSLTRVLWRLFGTEQQYNKLAKSLPPPHSNLFIDDKGFIYSTTLYDRSRQIKKINSVGADMYNGQTSEFSKSVNSFGERIRVNWTIQFPRFVDLAVDSDEMIYAVDANSGKVYKYDPDRDLLAVFAGRGEGRGLLANPSSIVVDNEGLVYILDSDRNMIQVFRPTEYAKAVQQAVSLYQQGEYEAAEEPWRKVLEMNSNLSLGAIGIAKAAYRRGDYRTAMEYFKLADERVGYSRAFAKLRYEYITDHFGFVVSVMIGIVALLYLIYRIARYIYRKPEARVGLLGRILQRSVKITISPAEGFSTIKEKGTFLEAGLIVAGVVILRLLSLQFTSFQLETIDKQDISPVAEIAKIIVPWVLFSLANYAVSTISDGEGHFRNVLIASAYCLTPYLLVTVPMTLLTHVSGTESAGTFQAVSTAVMCWILYLGINMIRVIHDFDLRKTVFNSAITVFAMACIVGMGGLGVGLLAKVYYLIQEIGTELAIR